MNYKSAGEMYFTTILEDILQQMFVELGMGRADWDLTHELRVALSENPKIKVVVDLLKSYDHNILLAESQFIKLKKKYYSIYKLWQSLNLHGSSQGPT